MYSYDAGRYCITHDIKKAIFLNVFPSLLYYDPINFN